MMQGTESEMAAHDHESIAVSLERFVREQFQVAGDDPFSRERSTFGKKVTSTRRASCRRSRTSRVGTGSSFRKKR